MPDDRKADHTQCDQEEPELKIGSKEQINRSLESKKKEFDEPMNGTRYLMSIFLENHQGQTFGCSWHAMHVMLLAQSAGQFGTQLGRSG